ncbi:MAG TPA: DUF2264 domain-containing protein [Candidatus Aquilonibacter sp.]|nr:DUF2264 domain-containing protein [Candidatus Aquilonibacter sp.]
MKKLILKAPLDRKLSPITGWTRKHWEECFYALMKGVVDSASPGGARQRIPGPRSHHGLLADELEGFTRSMIMAGPWLHSSKDGKYSWQGEKVDVAAFYRKGILAGTDPKHPEYWGDIVDYAQHLVEMAALTWGLYLSKGLIWDKFSAAEQKQVADYLFQCTKVKYHQNNWLLFNVITNSVLKKFGMPYSQEQIDANLAGCDHMYMGDGWYRDGNINRIDYYNAWAFLYYYLMWVILDGESKPDLAEKHKERARLFARDLRYFYAGDGSVPCFGRSMIYRFGFLSPLALGQHLGCLDIPAGEVKTLCNGVMKFFFANEILTEQNHLSMGFLRPCAEILEHYSCGGSPYWATKAFNLLMIQPDNPFWKTKEEKLPIHLGDYSVPMRSAGLLLTGDKETGHVQLINQKSYHDKAEYNAKYTKFAYSSIFSYEARLVYKNYNCDNILQFSADGINFRQRWEMTHLFCEKDFAASKYPLYDVDKDGTIHTSILVKDDFMINLHQVETKKQNLVFQEGGYPLGFDDGAAKTVSVPGAEVAYKDGKLTFIRNLHGWTKQTKALPFADDVNGSNVRYRQSVVPVLGFENASQEKFYLASMVCGRVGNDSIKKLSSLVKSFKLKNNTADIVFSDGERAFVQIGAIQDVNISLNGKKFAGPIMVARVSKDGRKWFVLESSGKFQTEGSK